jgi:hypothetical protein
MLNIVYLDGEILVPVVFDCDEAFFLWMQTMANIREAALLIVTRFPSPINPTIEQRRFINSWLELVQEAEDADVVVLPSILEAKVSFESVVKS